MVRHVEYALIAFWNPEGFQEDVVYHKCRVHNVFPQTEITLIRLGQPFLALVDKTDPSVCLRYAPLLKNRSTMEAREYTPLLVNTLPPKSQNKAVSRGSILLNRRFLRTFIRKYRECGKYRIRLLLICFLSMPS